MFYGELYSLQNLTLGVSFCTFQSAMCRFTPQVRVATIRWNFTPVRHVTNVITGWWGEGVAVALEPYNNVSLSILFSTHSSGMLNCMRARASCGCLRVSTAVFWRCLWRSVRFVWTGIRFVHIWRTNESNCWNDRCRTGTWGFAVLVGRQRSFVRLLVRSVPTLEERICPIFCLDCWNVGQYGATLLRKVRKHPATRRRISDDRSPFSPDHTVSE